MVYIEVVMTSEILKRRALKRLTNEVFIHKSKHREAKKWCTEQLGECWDMLDNRDGLWSMFWAGPANKDNDWQSHYRFCFAEEKDALWFSLRWS
jgi:hypothetical protein